MPTQWGTIQPEVAGASVAEPQVTIFNAFDPQAMVDAMASADGRKAIINAVQSDAA